MVMNLKVVSLIKKIVSEVVSGGDTVIDATVGNGYDTLFLAELVGDNGLVYGFDIQKEAVQFTRERLKASGMDKRVRLVCDGHERMDRYITGMVKAAVFNLGYLPGGCHRITTLTDTTLTAVNKSLEMLLPGGIVVIAVYCGHSEGQREENVLREFVSGLDAHSYMAVSVRTENQKNNPPVLYVVQRKNAVG
jgi:tRNA A58 N-methylase Trm61